MKGAKGTRGVIVVTVAWAEGWREAGITASERSIGCGMGDPTKGLSLCGDGV